MTFDFYRPPLAHQLRDFERFKDLEYHALFWEQRTRKTWLELNVFRYRYEVHQDIDALVVIAFPNGVHRVWIDELQKDWPPEFLEKTRWVAWRSGATTRGEEREKALALRDHLGPIVLTMNCEAIITDKGWKYLEWLLKRRRVMLVADEASWAAKWTKRTQKLEALGRRPNVLVRAILDGTPVDESPVEIYHPTQFLKRGLLGFPTKEAFRSRYTKYEEEVVDGVARRVQKLNHRTGALYTPVVGYANLDELHAKIMEFGSRVRRTDVSDAPEKTYQTRYFDLTAKQRAVYDDFRDKFVIELSSGVVTVANVLSRMGKLQMIARNFYPPGKIGEPCGACDSSGYTDDGEDCPRCDGLGMIVRTTDMERIDSRNPAAEALAAEIAATRGPVIVWCRYLQDVTDCLDTVRGCGLRAFRFDGTVPDKEREAAYHAFRAGEGDAIVATEKSGLSRGRDLTRAVCLIYYSNEWSLRYRGQSEDRAEGLDRKVSTDIVDLVATDTRDLDIINALREKRSIAAQVVGDPVERWI